MYVIRTEFPDEDMWCFVMVENTNKLRLFKSIDEATVYLKNNDLQGEIMEIKNAR